MVSAFHWSGAYERPTETAGVTYENGQGACQPNNVVGDYFKAADIKFITGRTFDATDSPATGQRL